jgi:hypothetical protein
MPVPQSNHVILVINLLATIAVARVTVRCSSSKWQLHCLAPTKRSYEPITASAQS